VLQLLILAVAVAKAMAKGRRGSQAHGVGQTKHSQAKPSTQFGNRISCSTSAYSTWLDLRAGDCPPSPNIHPPPTSFVAIYVWVPLPQLPPPLPHQHTHALATAFMCV